MVVERGEIWVANLPDPIGSGPGFRRPVLIVQSDSFNQTKLNTIIVAALTTNLILAEMVGNVLVSKNQSGLPKDSVINLTQVFTIDKRLLLEFSGKLSERKMEQIDSCLRLVLSL